MIRVLRAATASIVLLLLVSVMAQARPQAVLRAGVTTLMAWLERRDVCPDAPGCKPIDYDLALIGGKLAGHFGNDLAVQIVLASWKRETNGEPAARAEDAFWLVKQRPRVQDLGWLIAFPGEWMPKRR